MAKKRESFLLRTDPVILDALRRWADDEFRSVNAQLEFILRGALQDAGRMPATKRRGGSATRGKTPEDDASGSDRRGNRQQE